MQTKRRTRVKGCPGIYRSISGSYEIAYRDSDGRQVFKTLAKDVNLAAAKTERAEIVTKLGRGEPVRASRKTFGPFADDVVASMNRRPRTIGQLPVEPQSSSEATVREEAAL